MDEKKIKILFLDFDGVLNSHQSFIRAYRLKLDDRSKYTDTLDLRKATICPIAWSNFLHVMEEVPDLKLVISSSWRNDPSIGGMEGVKEALQDMGFDVSRIVGQTPRLEDRDIWGAGRGREIRTWLDESKLDVDYVVVDDAPIGIDSGLDNLFLTDPRVGLTYLDAIKIMTYFIPTFTPKEIEQL